MNIKGANFYALGGMVVFISFLGFVVENVWLSIVRGYVDNRNMQFPFLLGYGLAVVAIYLIFGTPSAFARKHSIKIGKWKISGYVLYFLMMMVIISVGEIALGTYMERKCDMKYWNYSWIPFHITPYTSIPTSIGFSLLLMLFEEYFFEPLLSLIARVPVSVLRVVSIVGLLVLTYDCFNSFSIMEENKGPNVRWRIHLRKLEHSGR